MVVSQPSQHSILLTCILQVKKTVNYAESSGEDDDELFAALKARKPRQRRSRPAVPDEEDEDTYEAEAAVEEEEDGNSCQPSCSASHC